MQHIHAHNPSYLKLQGCKGRVRDEIVESLGVGAGTVIAFSAIQVCYIIATLSVHLCGPVAIIIITIIMSITLPPSISLQLLGAAIALKIRKYLKYDIWSVI